MEVFPSIFATDAGRIASLALAMFVGGAGVAVPAALSQVDGGDQGCALLAPGVPSEPWVRTELFFGLSRPDGPAISDEEWESFLDAEITPRFPDGLTVISGDGQWQSDNGQIIEEGSKIVILLYPSGAIAESSAEIEAIRTAYEQRFHQESVLRADDDRLVCTSF